MGLTIVLAWDSTNMPRLTALGMAATIAVPAFQRRVAPQNESSPRGPVELNTPIQPSLWDWMRPPICSRR